MENKLKLNREFLRRHLFALAVFAGMGLWFGYDGFVRYPKTPAAELYESIESAKPPSHMSDAELEAFKRQKTATQYGLCFALLVAAGAIGLHLLVVARLNVSFDEKGFVWNGRRHAFDEAGGRVDDSKWQKKGVLTVSLEEGKLTLDAWHHTGVAEFRERLARV